ncbi:MAG: beta-L-arabinofuranosidase domain-containing protein [Asticcacaulis sp.]
MPSLSRRAVFLAGAAASSLTAVATAFAEPSVQKAKQAISSVVRPFPLKDVRLKASIFETAVDANQTYLLFLEPDRFLHNFHVFAGLPAKGEVYGGWEARGIAGHSLGHYLSACSLSYVQTGNEALKARTAYIIEQLLLIQAAQGDGYAGGTTVDRDGKTVDGKIIFEELRRGDIRTSGFDLNGGWVPIYTYHKVLAGTLDTHALCGNADALKVALGLGDYLGRIFEGLNDDQIQKILMAEHGGINESYAELYARTGDKRWLNLAERIRHNAVLDPITEGRDELAGKHANTQIPKVIGLARLYELTGEPRHAKAAMFFWETVTKDHSYVIGGPISNISVSHANWPTGWVSRPARPVTPIICSS